jgi:hypothetical protein
MKVFKNLEVLFNDDSSIDNFSIILQGRVVFLEKLDNKEM